jgi:hypothetical protein
MSSSESPALLSAFFAAGIGPSPMEPGSTPATAEEINLARGLKPNSLHFSSGAISRAHAPSFTPDELPAVTVPFSFANTGLSFDNFQL